MSFSSISDKVAHVKKAVQSRRHHCHWPDCNEQVAPVLWGCRNHWYALPRKLRAKLWVAYRIRQEETMTPSKQYIKVAREAQDWIKEYLNKRKQNE